MDCENLKFRPDLDLSQSQWDWPYLLGSRQFNNHFIRFPNITQSNIAHSDAGVRPIFYESLKQFFLNYT